MARSRWGSEMTTALRPPGVQTPAESNSVTLELDRCRAAPVPSAGPRWTAPRAHRLERGRGTLGDATHDLVRIGPIAVHEAGHAPTDPIPKRKNRQGDDAAANGRAAANELGGRGDHRAVHQRQQAGEDHETQDPFEETLDTEEVLPPDDGDEHEQTERQATCAADPRPAWDATATSGTTRSVPATWAATTQRKASRSAPALRRHFARSTPRAITADGAMRSAAHGPGADPQRERVPGRERTRCRRHRAP